jgi:hypothetical protein
MSFLLNDGAKLGYAWLQGYDFPANQWLVPPGDFSAFHRIAGTPECIRAV